MLIKKNIASFLILSLFVISAYLIIFLPQLSQATENPHFIVAASAQSPPFSFEDRNKKPQGILIDFWNLWARKNNADITFTMASFDKTIEMVRDGKADFHAGLFSSSQRNSYLDFSSGILDDTLSLFVQDKLDIKSITELKEIPIDVGISREYYAVAYMKEHYPYVNIKLFTNNEDLLNSTLRREIVAFIVDYPVANYYLSRKDSLGKYRVVEDIAHEKLRAAVKKGDLKNLEFINAGLKKITRQEVDGLSDKWGLRQNRIIPDWLKKALIISGIIIFLFSFFVHWIFLRREVKKQIGDLAEKNRLLTLMQRDTMEVNRTVQDQMQDLEKLNRNNEQMLDIITGEMKIPVEKINLTAAAGNASEQTLAEIHNESEKILLFIKKFMEVSSLESENYSEKMEKINLKSFFEKKKKDFKNIAQMKDIALDMQIPAKPISAMLHWEHFDELCNNIFLSTIKFSRPGGHIEVALDLTEKNNEKKIILKFRYHSTATSSNVGNAPAGFAGPDDSSIQPVDSASGIRLALVKKLVSLQRGKIFAEVNEKGERIIIVELPALEEIVKTYEDIETLLQTGDIILFKGLHNDNWGGHMLPPTGLMWE